MRNTIENAFSAHDLKYQIIREKADQVVFRLSMSSSNGRFETFVDLRPNDNQVLIYSTAPAHVAPEQRIRISEFLTRANLGLILGNFELDFMDGEIRYKTSFCFDETFPPSEEVFLRNLHASFHMLDKYLPGIMAVQFGSKKPETALNDVVQAGCHTFHLN